MKRSVLAVILILGALFCAFGQSSPPIDLILLLDTSSGMAPSYETVSDYVTGPFLSEFMRVGDTFHLITFSGSPRLDSARRIEGRGDVETIIGRMLIQYPVESGNDAAAAIRYAEDYAASLSSRQKRIVMVGLGAPNINDLISASRQRLSSINASLDFVLVTPGQPLTNLPSSRTPAAGASPAQTTQVPAQTTQTPTQTAQTQSPPAASSTPTTPAPEQPSTTASQTPSSTAPSQSQTETTQTPSTPEPQTAPQQSAGTSGASGEASSLPGETQAGTSSQSGGTAGTGTVQPQDTSVTPPPRGAQGDNNQAAASTTTRTGTGIFSSSLPLLIGIIVLALLILGLIIFFVSRRLGSSPNRVMASVSASKPQTQTQRQGEATAGQNRELSSYAASQNKQRTTPYSDRSARTENVAPAVINPQGPLLLNLFVEDQNTAIGKRNIHSLKSGYSLTVGGGKSDFLIFLVAVPPNIGEIHRNGSQCTFIPRKPKYFPDLGSSEVRDCINKTIRIVSDKDYELCFRFEMYQDPLETLNKILHSVKVPG